MSDVRKLKCPKCRRILFRYKDSIEIVRGNFSIYIECPECKTGSEIEFNNEENSKKKMDAEGRKEVLKKFEAE